MEIVLDRWHSASYAQAHEKLDLFSNVTAVLLLLGFAGTIQGHRRDQRDNPVSAY